MLIERKVSATPVPVALLAGPSREGLPLNEHLAFAHDDTRVCLTLHWACTTC